MLRKLATPLALLAFSTAALTAQAAPVYTVELVGNIGAGLNVASAVNNLGQVAGGAQGPNGGFNAYVSTNGTATNLHPTGIATATGSSASGINDAGVVVGQVNYQDASSRAAIFSGGNVQIFGTFGGNFSTALDINASGQVVGTSFLAGNNARHAFIIENGAMVDLGTFGGKSSIARAINDAGAVTGSFDLIGGGAHGFLWQGGSHIDLGTLGGTLSEGQGINSAGNVVGYSYIAQNQTFHAFLYANGTMADLGTLGTYSSAVDINDAGDIVGTSVLANGASHGFVYRGGAMQDINELIDASLGWTITDASAINDKGQIAARGCNAAGKCAGLLLSLVETDADPASVPEPEAFTAGLIGLALLGALRRRRQ